MKFLVLLALAIIVCKVLTRRWPWDFFRHALPPANVSQARNLLGVGANANRIEIIEAHKALVARVHPDKGGTNEQVYEANAARDLLLARVKPSISE